MASSTQTPTPAIGTSAAMLGVLLAVAGAHHGVLEVLQGSRPTGSVFFMAIVPGQLGWEQGTEGALSLIPNYLLTGLAAIGVSGAVAVWSVAGMHRSHAASVLLLLFVLLTLVGGGVGHIAFFVPLCAYATRIDRPLSGWRKLLPGSVRRVLPKLWATVLALTLVAFVIALEISIFGIAVGLGDEPEVLALCWTFLGASWFLLHGTFACAAAADIEQRDTSATGLHSG